uniref:Uncharacterized protein n=1 Tax=Rhizophora mucronata TaxID=61149 RepID=A0A2P2P7P3_RHIMU
MGWKSCTLYSDVYDVENPSLSSYGF